MRGRPRSLRRSLAGASPGSLWMSSSGGCLSCACCAPAGSFTFPRLTLRFSRPQRHCCHDLRRQFSAHTFWLRPRIFLLTSSETGLWWPHLKHDIMVEQPPSVTGPNDDPGFLVVYLNPSPEIVVVVSLSR